MIGCVKSRSGEVLKSRSRRNSPDLLFNEPAQLVSWDPNGLKVNAEVTVRRGAEELLIVFCESFLNLCLIDQNYVVV
jgi:hypothetical protein